VITSTGPRSGNPCTRGLPLTVVKGYVFTLQRSEHDPDRLAVRAGGDDRSPSRQSVRRFPPAPREPLRDPSRSRCRAQSSTCRDPSWCRIGATTQKTPASTLHLVSRLARRKTTQPCALDAACRLHSSARGETRTRAPLAGKSILSRPRLPTPPPGPGAAHAAVVVSPVPRLAAIVRAWGSSHGSPAAVSATP
jgi:hypothetical protein